MLSASYILSNSLQHSRQSLLRTSSRDEEMETQTLYVAPDHAGLSAEQEPV